MGPSSGPKQELSAVKSEKQRSQHRPSHITSHPSCHITKARKDGQKAQRWPWGRPAWLCPECIILRREDVCSGQLSFSMATHPFRISVPVQPQATLPPRVHLTMSGAVRRSRLGNALGIQRVEGRDDPEHTPDRPHNRERSGADVSVTDGSETPLCLLINGNGP